MDIIKTGNKSEYSLNKYSPFPLQVDCETRDLDYQRKNIKSMEAWVGNYLSSFTKMRETVLLDIKIHSICGLQALYWYTQEFYYCQ